MDLQFPLATVPLSLTVASCAATAFFLWKNFARKESEPSLASANLIQVAVMILLSLYALGQLVAVVTTTALPKLAGMGLTLAVSLWMAVAWFVFSLFYTGRDRWVSRRAILALSAVPAAGTVLIATNAVHGLVFVGPELVGEGSRTVLDFGWGVGAWAISVYDFGLCGLGAWFLTEKFLTSRNVYRKISFFHVVGALALNVGAFLSLVGASPLEYFALSVSAFAVVILVTAPTAVSYRYIQLIPLDRLLSVFGGRVRSLAPMARDTIVEEMQSGVVVVDHDNRIVDLNPLGRKMIAAEDRRVVGENLKSVVPPDSFDTDDTSFLDPETTSGEFRGVWVTTETGEQRCFDVLVTVLGPDDDPAGRVALINDVTAQQQRKQAIEETMDAGVVIVGDDGRVVDGNPAAAELLDAPTDEIVGTDVGTVLPEVGPAVTDEGTGDLEFSREAEGKRRHYIAEWSPLAGTDANRGRIVTVRDISSRKEREEERKRYETIVEAIGDPVFTLDEGGQFTFASEAVREYGWTPEEIVGSYPTMAMDWEDVKRVEETVRDLATDDERTTATLQFDVTDRNGDPIPSEFKFAIIEDEAGRFQGTAAVGRSIENRKERLETLREREQELEQYETIVKSLADPVWATDAEGYYTYVNPAFEDLFGYSQEYVEEEGLHYTELMPEEDARRQDDIVRRLLSDDNDETRAVLEVTGIGRDGRRIHTELNSALLPHGDEFDGMAGVARDNSDHKRRQEVLDVMNRALRHNLRTHVNSILGYAELVRESVDEPPVEHVRRIEESANWLGTMGDTLRNLHRAVDQDRDGSDVVDVTDLVERTVESYRETHPRASIQTHLPPGERINAGQALEYALDQIVDNAVRHNDADDPEVHVTMTPAPKDGWVDLRIEDDGPGIPAEERDLVTGKEEITQLHHASGLGLWVSRWVVEAFDGELRFEDNDPRGSVVILRLQRATVGGRSGRATTESGE